MANTMKCEDCAKYFKLERATRKNKKIDTRKGHCLARTIYAKDRPGHRPYPPKARVEKLPFDRHKVVIVRADQVVSSCTNAEPK